MPARQRVRTNPIAAAVMRLRRSADRGHASHGWLESFHSFSFADYYDPEFVSFGALRVINEDRVQPGKGFGTHGHRDMEILSYVLGGRLEHKDSIGTGSVIVPGDVQRMSAGSGIMHSEYNPSRDEPVHFLQVWIQPNVTGIRPSYEQKRVEREEKRGRMMLIASPDGFAGSVVVHQDARVFASVLEAGDAVDLPLAEARRAYVHVARGVVHLNGERLLAGDAVMLQGERAVSLDRAEGAEVLVFDLA